MNARLISSCACLWLVGLLGMVVSRVLFDLGPGALSFELSARLWGVGGLGYLVLATVACTGEHESLTQAHAERAPRQ